jgi:hypothetical protein
MRRAIAPLILLLVTAVAPPGAAAHVNRTVGPYTILVVLVEEPFYQDNHAGFEFWVHRGTEVMTGLEQSLHATASGHGTTVTLPMSPLGPDGFYVLDRTADGTAFDPLSGGAWTLTLTGSIDGTDVRTTFPVMFPSYPRVASPAAPAAQVDSGQARGAGSPPAWVLLGALAAAAACAALAWSRRPRRVAGRA